MSSLIACTILHYLNHVVRASEFWISEVFLNVQSVAIIDEIALHSWKEFDTNLPARRRPVIMRQYDWTINSQ
jgi:hypothetical protein